MSKIILHGEVYDLPIGGYIKEDFKKFSKRTSLFSKDRILNMDNLVQAPNLDITAKYQYYRTLFERVMAAFCMHIESGFYGDYYEKSDSLRKKMFGTQNKVEEYAKQGRYEDAITEMDELIAETLEFYKNMGAKSR